MKMVKYWQWGWIWIFSIWSCTDALDVQPKNSVTFLKALSDEREIEIALGSVEYGLKQDVLISVNTVSFPEIYGWINDDGATSSQTAEFLAPTNSAYVFRSWSGWYSVIARANLVIPYLDQVKMTAERRNYYLGQVYFFKAFCYYNLILKWGDVPYIHEHTILDPIPKTPWVIVADSAIAMAERAARLLPEADDAVHYNGGAVLHRSAPSKGAAYTLMAYLYAWKAGAKYVSRPEYRDYDEEECWKRAEKACSYVVDSCRSYALAGSAEEMCTETLVGDSREGIFETVLKDRWLESGGLGEYPLLAKYFVRYPLVNGADAWYQNAGAYVISAATVSKMYPGTDERRQAFFYRFDNGERTKDKNSAFLYKWREAVLNTTPGKNYGRFQNINQNKIWFRLADVILLRGECRARLGNDAGAIADINRIRERSGASLYAPSDYPGRDVRFAVFKEREKELLYEGFRWFDIIRNGYIREMLKGGYKTASNQDFVDGCMFLGVASLAFERNTLMRQNVYWWKNL